MYMVVSVGEKVHVIERRMFESDVRRHFFGTVERVDAVMMRLVGYAFIYDSGMSAYVRGRELRTRIIPLAGAGLVINVAPEDANVADVRYVDENGRLVITDGASFSMDINEFGRAR